MNAGTKLEAARWEIPPKRFTRIKRCLAAATLQDDVEIERIFAVGRAWLVRERTAGVYLVELQTGLAVKVRAVHVDCWFEADQVRLAESLAKEADAEFTRCTKEDLQ